MPSRQRIAPKMKPIRKPQTKRIKTKRIPPKKNPRRRKKRKDAEDNKGDTEEESETAVEAAKQDMIDNLKEETQGNVEDAFAVDDELPFNMDDIEVPENEEKAEFVEMLMNVMHAAITIYLAINYWYTYLPNTTGQPFDRQVDLPRGPLDGDAPLQARVDRHVAGVDAPLAVCALAGHAEEAVERIPRWCPPGDSTVHHELAEFNLRLPRRCVLAGVHVGDDRLFAVAFDVLVGHSAGLVGDAIFVLALARATTERARIVLPLLPLLLPEGGFSKRICQHG